jgi:hypothetical protein
MHVIYHPGFVIGRLNTTGIQIVSDLSLSHSIIDKAPVDPSHNVKLKLWPRNEDHFVAVQAFPLTQQQ